MFVERTAYLDQSVRDTSLQCTGIADRDGREDAGDRTGETNARGEVAAWRQLLDRKAILLED